MRPSIAYPDQAKEAYWGPVTSTLNWCEEDYLITSYTAEFINSFTNGLFMLLGVKGVLNCIREGHDTVFLVTFLGYLLIGLGSFAFHATLWYSMQLVDELSMINTTLIMYFATFAYGKSRRFSAFLAVLLLSIAGTITAVYHYLQEPKFHQNAYAVLTAIVLGRSVYLMETRLRTQDSKTVKELWQLVGSGFLAFGVGFALWTGDRFLCDQLIGIRRAIGLPWGFLLEGHGHWHLFTGLGGYFYITYGIYLRHCLNGTNEYELVWPSLWTSLPVVRRKRDTSAKDKKNL